MESRDGTSAQTVEEAALIDSWLAGLEDDVLPFAIDGRPAPLSFAQERLWFLDQLDPGQSAYNIVTPVELHGELDLAALGVALDGLLARHESLRTHVATVDGQLCQIVSAPRHQALELVDLGGEEGDPADVLARHLGQLARTGFELSSGPLFRAFLLRLKPDHHALVLVTHHIVSDGWSIGVLNRELSALYKAAVAGKEANLPALPIQYGDYAAWQRGWMQGAALERQLSYWTGRLQGAPAALELPTDTPRPPLQSYRGASKRIVLSRTLTEQLTALGREEGATLFMTLLAAFQVLLSRYSGQDDIVIGTPIANRTRVETEGLIGFFVNTLALRGNPAGNPSFRQHLRQVREEALGAYAHQDLPFEKLVEALQPERDLSRHPIFQAMFILQNAPSSPLQLDGVTSTPILHIPTAAKMDILVSLTPHVDGIGGYIDYEPTMYSGSFITSLILDFLKLLEEIVQYWGMISTQEN